MNPIGITIRQPAFERGLALFLCSVALLVQCFPALADSMQWQRSAGTGMAIATTLTGHLAHWSWSHFTWDLLAFAGLSFAAIALIPGRYFLCVFLSAILIPVEIYFLQPEFETYRGLSGIDSALFGLVLVGLWKIGPAVRPFAAAGISGFIAKCLYESLTGDTLFVAREAEDFIPVGSAHVVGFLCGLVAGIVPFPGSPAGKEGSAIPDSANRSRSSQARHWSGLPSSSPRTPR